MIKNPPFFHPDHMRHVHPIGQTDHNTHLTFVLSMCKKPGSDSAGDGHVTATSSSRVNLFNPSLMKNHYGEILKRSLEIYFIFGLVITDK